MASRRLPLCAPCSVDESKPAGIGMRRRLHDLAQRAAFHDSPGIHDRDAIADLDRDADVVRDENHRHAEFALKFPQQKQNLDLHRGVERGRRLVGEQHFRAAGERERDHGALAHAAGHLVRIGIESPLGRRDAHALQHFERALAPVGEGGAFMLDHGFRDLVADGVDRVERKHRLLEDHRHGAAAHALERLVRHRHDILPVDLDAAADIGAMRRQHPQQRAQGHALAGAGLAKQPQHLALARAKCRRH